MHQKDDFLRNYFGTQNLMPTTTTTTPRQQCLADDDQPHHHHHNAVDSGKDDKEGGGEGNSETFGKTCMNSTTVIGKENERQHDDQHYANKHSLDNDEDNSDDDDDDDSSSSSSSSYNDGSKKSHLTNRTSRLGVPPLPLTSAASRTTASRNHHHNHHSHVVSEQASALVIAASDKAGMNLMDRSRIDAIILRESGNSLYIQQQKRRDQKVNERIEQMKQRLLEQDQAQTHSNYYQSHQNKRIKHINNNNNNNNNNNKTKLDWKCRLEQELDLEIPIWLRQRRSHSTIVVVDMDMFYMACELLSRPDLCDKPACVGTGIILTSNYCARQYGVRSAMAGWIGDQLVHELSNGQEQLFHVPAHYDLYKKKSKQVMTILTEYDPHLQSHSLDEAYLDIGPYLALKLLTNERWSHERIKTALLATSSYDTLLSSSSLLLTESSISDQLPNDHPQDDDASYDSTTNPAVASLLAIVNNNSSHVVVDQLLALFPSERCLECATCILSELRHKVFVGTQGLTCSAGLAPNIMLAKMASDHQKPNGQVVVGPTQDHHVLTFLHPMPVRKVPGIGRVTEKILRAFDIYTVKDLYHQRALIQFLFQPATARFLWLASLGCCIHSTTTTATTTSSSSDFSSTVTPATGVALVMDISPPSLPPKTKATTRTRGLETYPKNHHHDKTIHSTESFGQKGISRERTFASGRPWSEVSARLEEIARGLSVDMKQKNLWARTLTVKVKLHTFDVVSRSRTLGDNSLSSSQVPPFLQDPHDMVRLSMELLLELKAERKKGQSFSVRLLGIRCCNFVHEKERTRAMSSMKQTYLSLEQQNRFSDHYNKHKTIVGSEESTSKKHLTILEKTTRVAPKVTWSGQGRRSPDHAFPMNSSWHTSSGDNETNSNPNELVLCPVCGTSLLIANNEQFNRHLDSCLNAPVIRQAIREESRRGAVTGRDNNSSVRSSSVITTTSTKSKLQQREMDDFFSFT